MVDHDAVAWEDPVVTWTADLAGEERLANRWGTFFIRFIWRIIALGSIPALPIWIIWWRPDRASLLLFGIAAVLMPAYYWLVARPLRWVWAGADGLRVSDGWREVRIPYSEVEDVRGFWYARDLVRVALKAPTAVGARFIFIPRWRWSVRGDHPVVAQLRDRASLVRN
jgi:hypothetical protein